MKEIEKKIPVHPSSRALEICQDRMKEKNLIQTSRNKDNKLL
jgi:phosphoribosylaminoimidazole carboxylase (NCAIR synthetase)